MSLFVYRGSKYPKEIIYHSPFCCRIGDKVFRSSTFFEDLDNTISISRVSYPSRYSFESSRIYDRFLALSEEFSLIFKETESIYRWYDRIIFTISVLFFIEKFSLFPVYFEHCIIPENTEYFVRWEKFSSFLCFFYSIRIKNNLLVPIIFISERFEEIINRLYEYDAFSTEVFFHIFEIIAEIISL